MRKVVALVAGAALVWSLPAGAQETKLKAVSFLPLTQSFGVHFKRWVDEVNKRGKGVLQIDAVGPEAIPVPEQPNAVKNGVVQMHYGPPTFYTGTMWEGEALSLSETTIKNLRANGAWAYLDKLHQEKMNSVLLAGDIALLRGTWHATGTTPDGAPITLSGTDAVVARRQADGTWRMVIDDANFVQ